MTSKPFSAKSLDNRFQKFGLRGEIVRTSRDEYGMEKEVIEDKIRRWSEQKYSESGNRSLDPNAKPKDIKQMASNSSNMPVVIENTSTEIVPVIDEPSDLNG